MPHPFNIQDTHSVVALTASTQQNPEVSSVDAAVKSQT